MFRGWLNVGVAFSTNFLAMGSAFYAFGVVLEPISREFPDSGRLGASMVPIFMGISMAFCAPFMGKLIPRVSLRWLMSAGCVVGAVGFYLSARVVELWQLCLIFGTIIAVCEQMMGGISAQVLVVNWFEKNRTLALGISLLGLSLSGVVMPHVATYIGEEGGWRAVFQSFAWFMLIACPFVWLFVIDKPERIGLGVDGVPLSEAPPRTAPPSYRLMTIYTDPVLWAIALPVGIAFTGATAILLHSFAFAKDLGFTDAHAAWFITAVAGGAAAGKVGFSWLAQKIGNRQAFVASLVSQLLGFIGLIFLDGETANIVSVTAVGIGFGGIIPLVGAILASLWGRESFAPILGAIFPLFTLFQAAGAPLAGYVYDQKQTYEPVFWLFGFAILVAIYLANRIPSVHANLERYHT
tara:strand:- start:1552 stop:2778 length:1227 start_codon:yes stop_codon:yes gene_type:complete